VCNKQDKYNEMYSLWIYYERRISRMTIEFKSGVSNNNNKYYYVEIFIDEEYSIKKFLTKEEAYILKKNNLLK